MDGSAVSEWLWGAEPRLPPLLWVETVARLSDKPAGRPLTLWLFAKQVALLAHVVGVLPWQTQERRSRETGATCSPYSEGLRTLLHRGGAASRST